jgi:c(7)-type cytochrome triheme protein
MRVVIALFITVSLTSGAAVAAQHRKPPRRLVFPTKAGEVAFNHAAHLKREKGDCTHCHDKLWPQSATAPIKSSTECGACHHANGRSFAMKGNCAKCHTTKGSIDRRGSG